MDSSTIKKVIASLKDESDVKTLLKSRFYKKEFNDDDLSLIVNLAEHYDDFRYLTYKYIEKCLVVIYESNTNPPQIHHFIDFIVNVTPKDPSKAPKMLLKSSPVHVAIAEEKKKVVAKKNVKTQKTNGLAQYEQLLAKMEREAALNDDKKKARQISKLLNQIGGEYEREYLKQREAANRELTMDIKKTKATHQKLSVYCDPNVIQAILTGIFQNIFAIDNNTPLPEATKKLVLENLAKMNLKHSENLIGFCATNLKVGGISAIFCLEIIFKLVVEKSVEYPNFYPSFYKILNANLFRTVHRVRLFELMNLFLMSTYLPKQYVAAFIKKLAALALISETPARLFLAPFVVSLLLRFPETQYLINSPQLTEEKFNMEADIDKCNVEETCLWELVTLANDKNPTIRSMIKKLESGKAIKSEFNLSGLVQNSYTTLIKKEFRKAVVDPAMNHCRPNSLFSVNSSKFDAGNFDIIGESQRIIKGASRKNDVLSEISSQVEENMSNQIVDVIADRLVMNSYLIELERNWI